jgi:uncharacterized protein YjbJ (UPF0337 family)
VKCRNTPARLVGSTEQQAKGHAREFEGKAQKAAGDVKENLKDASKDLQKDLNPLKP